MSIFAGSGIEPGGSSIWCTQNEIRMKWKCYKYLIVLLSSNIYGDRSVRAVEMHCLHKYLLLQALLTLLYKIKKLIIIFVYENICIDHTMLHVSSSSLSESDKTKKY